MTEPARAGDDPVKAVRSWYNIVRKGSWVAGGDGGTLGDPQRYRIAYQRLAPNLRAALSEKSFLDLFTHTVYVRLDQAELISTDGQHATVFVEDQRDMILEDLPATVRYYGSISLVREHEGWAIDGFQIAPEESMISLRDFGHSSAGYINDTSMVAFGQYLEVPGVDPRHIRVPANISQGPVMVTYDDGVNKVVLELAKLYSGGYVPLIVRDLSTRGRQPRVLFQRPSEPGWLEVKGAVTPSPRLSATTARIGWS